MTLRVLIVDDEPLARRRIRRLLRAHPDATVIGECGNADEAMEIARRELPDVLMVDVQMPGLDGFGLLRALGTQRPRAVVFTTAFDEYAVRAFEVNALDYLVKPFNRARFDDALSRARAALQLPNAVALMSRAGHALNELGASRAASRLVVKRDGRTLVVDVADVQWIEAERNGVRVHTGKGVFALGEAISQLERRLDSAHFVRVHRSTIVNVACIAEVQPWFHGDAVLVLQSGARVRLSRTHRPRLAALLGQPV
jgi:two-component system LytT family response regulator